jgi:hypothetical protein
MMPQRDGPDRFADLFGVGVETLVRNAFRLGLTWRMRPGTVTEATSLEKVMVRLDGDTASILVTSMIGQLPLDERVYVITIPPGGNFAIGWVTFRGTQRIATTTRVANIGTFTVETLVDSVTAYLVVGHTYRIVWYGRVFKDVADGIARGRIREDSISGTALAITQLYTATVINQSFPLIMETQYVATLSGNKTFVATVTRQTGTGNLTAQAATDAPTLFYVELIE